MPRGDDRGKRKTMENIFFKPWIGEDYETGGIFGKKILVVGESHYCGHCERCGDVANAEECAEFTTNHCIQPLLDGYTAGWTGTFHKFERSLVGHETDLNESRKIWNSVAFYNYIQKAMDGPRTSPDWTDFRDAEAAFLRHSTHCIPTLLSFGALAVCSTICPAAIAGEKAKVWKSTGMP